MGTTYLNSDKCSLPLEVVAREGEHSYTIEIKEGVIIKAHRSFLKKSFNNPTMGQ